MKTKDTGQVAEEIRQYSRHLVRELDILKGVYLGSGFTFSQCHVLFELAAHKTMSLMELADCLLMDKSNASRTVKQLLKLGVLNVEQDSKDNRQKKFSLTVKGRQALSTTICNAERQVHDALENLTEQQQETVVQGMRLYVDALKKSRLQANFVIRPIKKKDNPEIARIIRDVMTEFQAVGAGYSINDAEVDNIYGSYRSKNSCYYVITLDDEVVGGGGIGPLAGDKESVCELRKMFFLPQTRGIGLGQKLLLLLLDEARKRGYTQCYLETLDRMWQANELYKKNGFKPLENPIGCTGHHSCDRWYILDL